MDYFSRWRLPLMVQLTAVVLLPTLITLMVLALAHQYEWPMVWLVLVTAIIALTVSLTLVRRHLKPILSMFRALEGTVSSYRDHDYSFSLNWSRNDEIRDLVKAHNVLGETLREQRLALVQRELLLDAMVQNSPVAMVLTQAQQRIVYGNLMARRLFANGRKLEGLGLADLLQELDPAINLAITRDEDTLFTVGSDDTEEVFHLSKRRFVLNGRPHQLLSVRPLTHELRRQEVQTWKKVIRVISHELNNSLAPIASLSHSGAEMMRRGKFDNLPEVFETIEGRARHLEEFIRSYARFAKLPLPQSAMIEWPDLMSKLQAQYPFELLDALPVKALRADRAQLEQALLNLLKNAHEASGSDAFDATTINGDSSSKREPAVVQMRVKANSDGVRIEVLDRGTGMSEHVLAQALVPFYSTKRSGTGLGLALAREIVEAHGGRISLANRDGGGLIVSIVLPA